MGTTVNGLPYPEPTAPVANGAADIRALAEAVDLKSATRIGGTWKRNAAQTISSGGVTLVLFDTETADTSGFLTPPSAQATIPAGLGGTYAIAAQVQYAIAALGLNLVRITAGGIVYDFPGTTTAGYQAGGVTVPLAAAATVKIETFHSNGANQNIIAANLALTRIGP
jgi:hypothetical protein